MIKLFKIWMILTPFTVLFAQEFEFPIVVADGNHDQVISIGIHPAGTDSFDIGLDFLAPPPPPAGAFDTRLTFLDEDYYKDVRKNTNSLKEFYLSYSPGSGGSITLRWDSSLINDLGNFVIVDNNTGNLFYFDMSSGDFLDVSTHPDLSDGLKIMVTPFIPTAINDEISNKDDLYKEIILSQNYPNPFNGSTRIKYFIPLRSYVKLNLYNINGTLVRKLINEVLGEGKYSVIWDGQNDFGVHAGSGMYIYQILVGNVVEAKRLIYLK